QVSLTKRPGLSGSPPKRTTVPLGGWFAIIAEKSRPGDVVGDSCVQVVPSHDHVSLTPIHGLFPLGSGSTPPKRIDVWFPGSNAKSPSCRFPGVVDGFCCDLIVSPLLYVSIMYTV